MTSDVRSEAPKILGDVVESFRGVLAGLPRQANGPRALERALGLQKTLCWRILQVANARDPLHAAIYVPGEEGLEKFLTAAGAAGATETLLAAARSSVARYRTAIKAHAGDRASFEVMMQALAASEVGAVELKAARRAGFRSSSYAWGVQTAVRILSVIIQPVGDELVDLATIRAHVNARRVHPDGRLRLSRTIEHDTDAPGARRAMAQPIVPEHVQGGVPLLPDFCTSPLPRLEAVTLPDGGNVEYQIVEQDLGARAEMTIFTGEVRRGLSGARFWSEANASNAVMMTVRDPVGLLVLDLWSPPGFASMPRALVVSAAGVDPLQQRPSQWHVLPTSVGVERMGRGLPAARLDEVPQYEPAVRQCFERLKWGPGDFELHRLRTEYPVLGSCLVLQTDLPPRPACV